MKIETTTKRISSQSAITQGYKPNALNLQANAYHARRDTLIQSVSENQASHWIHANSNFVQKTRIKWKGKSIRDVQCQVWLHIERIIITRRPNPLRKMSVHRWMKMIEAITREFLFLFSFTCGCFTSSPTHTQFMPSTYDSLREWLHYPSKRSTTATGPSNAATKMFSMRCEATQIVVEILNIYK